MSTHTQFNSQHCDMDVVAVATPYTFIILYAGRLEARAADIFHFAPFECVVCVCVCVRDKGGFWSALNV